MTPETRAEARESFERMMFAIARFASENNLSKPTMVMNKEHRGFLHYLYADAPHPPHRDKMTFAGVVIRFGEITNGEVFQCRM